MPLEIQVQTIDEDGVDDEWREAKESVALSGKVSKISVSVESLNDQGWGNTKGHLGLALYNPQGEFVAREDLFGTIRSAEYLANYKSSPAREIGTEAEIVSKAEKGATYKLEYIVGHGGGHELHVDDWVCKVLFQGEDDDDDDPAKAMFKKYSVAICKVIAGAIRFFFEDLLSGGCQLIYLCKKWHVISLGSKVFTLTSIATGVALSLAGPLFEYVAARRLRQQVMEASPSLFDPKNRVDEDAPEEQKTPLLSEQQTMGVLASVSTAANTETKVETKDLERNEAQKQKHQDVGITVVPNIGINEIVRGRNSSDGAGNSLFVGAILFWFVMMVLPFLVPIECGKSVPGKALFIFFGTSMSLSLLEIWVTVQTRRGYLMFKHVKGKYLLGYALSHLGRFDTYGDVTFAKMIATCEPITWFSIYDHYFYLPFGWDLASMVLVILIIGVLLFQALPGVVLLACRKRPGWKDYLPIAFKLNEYNLLLSVMVEEADPTEHNDEKEDRIARNEAMKLANAMGIAMIASTAAVETGALAV